MKMKPSKVAALAGAGLFSIASLLPAQEAAPKVSVSEFEAKILKDSTPVANAEQPVASYADIVDRVLPSVVTISTYSKKSGKSQNMQEQDIEQIPPMFREFFKEWMERQGGDDSQPQAPQQRGQRPRGPQKPVQTGLGSGIILTDDGYIMTNNHVVENADELKVSIGGRGREYVAKIIGTDPSTDVALIKIEATGLAHATMGNSTNLRVGDVVLAAGAPTGLTQSVSQGIVSALGRSQMGIVGNMKTPGYEDFIQTDAAINPGNSGGPLIDAKGRVIGINTAIETRTGMFSGIGFAIPINMALNIVSDLLDDGKVDRGFLGIQMAPLEQSMAEFLGLKDEDGVTVSNVVDGSPAEKAGFEGGDVVISANGEKVQDPSKLRLLVSSKHAGEAVKFGVVRYDEQAKQPKTIELTAILEKLEPERLNANFRGPGGKNEAPKNDFLSGVRVQNLTDALRQEYNLEPDVQGVLVTSVAETSHAANVGLQEGDVITQVNRRPIKNTAEALSSRGEAGGVTLLKILREGQVKFLPIKN